MLVKQSQWRFLLILAKGRSATYRAEQWCGAIFVFPLQVPSSVPSDSRSRLRHHFQTVMGLLFKGMVWRLQSGPGWGA